MEQLRPTTAADESPAAAGGHSSNNGAAAVAQVPSRNIAVAAAAVAADSCSPHSPSWQLQTHNNAAAHRGSDSPVLYRPFSFPCPCSDSVDGPYRDLAGGRDDDGPESVSEGGCCFRWCCESTACRLLGLESCDAPAGLHLHHLLQRDGRNRGPCRSLGERPETDDWRGSPSVDFEEGWAPTLVLRRRFRKTDKSSSFWPKRDSNPGEVKSTPIR